MNQVLRLCLPIIEDVRRHEPAFEVEVRMGRAEEFPAPRNFAYCVSESPPVVVYAPKLARQDPERILGVMMHEIAGHALFFWRGREEHSERAADTLAEKVCRARISYDRDLLVQTTGEGIRPRPAELG